MHRTPRGTLSLLAALTICSGAARAAEPDTIFLRFEVYGGPGLHFLTLHVTVDQARERYSLGVDAATRGIADLFVDLRSRLALVFSLGAWAGIALVAVKLLA
jgi:hypothetical protein